MKDTESNTYVVATVKDWNVNNFYERTSELPGNWVLLTQKEELTVEYLNKISPKYIFFPHWSWIVPDEILSKWDCVCFHMTDVPYGRGGSPLQNLIVRGHNHTKLTALKMEKELDAGPVYKKVSLSLDGSAQDIFERTSDKVYNIIAEIILEEPTPCPQHGEVVSFSRRTKKDSELPSKADLKMLYNYIRMLDADTYPKAYMNYGNFRIEFEDAENVGGEYLSAKVKITMRAINEEDNE